MSVIFTAKLILAAINILFGIVTLIRPELIASLIGLKLDTPQVRAEVRVQFGGLYLALGVAVIMLRFYPTAFLVFGIAYAGMAITRLALLRDKALRTPLNFAVLAFEIVCAFVFIAESSWFIV